MNREPTDAARRALRPDAARARGAPARRGRKDLEGDCRAPQHQQENGRDLPCEHHAEAGHSRYGRSRALRDPPRPGRSLTTDSGEHPSRSSSVFLSVFPRFTRLVTTPSGAYHSSPIVALGTRLPFSVGAGESVARAQRRCPFVVHSSSCWKQRGESQSRPPGCSSVLPGAALALRRTAFPRSRLRAWKRIRPRSNGIPRREALIRSRDRGM